ncbi:BCCT family transporter [Paenibacillus sp. CGMCC 1.16610]|uniref:BCCT family transporter n=1 Tax=Paenibacillus anseongense TaxID=2682845 RepID=A0ABW9UHW7_9BACL|nr:MULTISPECIES: BCCT family transporter [Paenibacillus]MBA2939808.1 BCCT family transporter [Paenibacillus sp. CGMCC 1.16610]MVQ39468.1 BCCT family transporter [Paenibacillus anseongense]
MVLSISIGIILIFVLCGAFAPVQFAATATSLFDSSIRNFGWFFLISTFGCLVFAFYLAFSKYGRIKLGKDEDEPEYSTISWFAMLFSAGMGIGLVFWGVAEPLSHYLSPPEGATGGSTEAARLAMRYSFFHWGVHPWAIYTIISLTLAYFQFRHDKKGLISAVFSPLIGKLSEGGIGAVIDILAIIATAFGVATSLGLGALQINGGLNHMFGISIQPVVQVVIIGIVTVLFLISATTGLDKGIRILSNANLLIAVLLMAFVFLVGPTSFILDLFTSTLGGYLQNLVYMSLRMTPFTQGTWVGVWTLFYWAWWIAWGPFVGTFIARVSKGRTIKEFVLGVLLVPSLFSFMWFSVFGGTGLHLELFDQFPIAAAAKQDVTSALFLTLQQLPIGHIIALIATILIITFFITSADSATFVLGMLSTKGDPNPSNKVKIVWGGLQSSMAIVLLISGGLSGLQTASIIAALPFAIIIIGMCVSLMIALRQDEKSLRSRDDRRMKKLDELLSIQSET